jgi:hypothetical protein
MVVTLICDVISSIAGIATVVGVYIAILHLRNQVTALKADHERHKKQSTIEFFYQLNEHTSNIVNLMDQHVTTGVVNKDKIDADAELRHSVWQYLSKMESFSVGINIGVYDLHTYNRIAGRIAIKRFDTLRPWIEELRDRNSAPTMFTDYENMIGELNNIRRGNISKGTNRDNEANLQYDLLVHK